MRMELTPFPEPRADNSACTCSDFLALTKLTCLGEPKCSHGEYYFGLARRVTLLSKKGDLAKWVTLLVKPTFCFSCRRFAKFCKDI